MNIYLIRHSQSTMNQKGKVFSGSTNVSLSPEGISATQKLSQHPLWETIDHVYTSSLDRAKQTASLLFHDQIPSTVIPEFCEMDFGDYEGALITDANKNDPVFYNWLHNPEKVTFPNGDNLVEHATTAFNALNNLVKDNPNQNIVIVSHATTIRLILSLLMTGTVNSFRNIPCDNSCVSMLTYTENKLKAKYINSPLRY